MILNESLFEELDDCEECKEEELKETVFAGDPDDIVDQIFERLPRRVKNRMNDFWGGDPLKASGKWFSGYLTGLVDADLINSDEAAAFEESNENNGNYYGEACDKELKECDKQDQELTEKAWKIQVPEETARNFRDALEAEDLAGAAKELQGILDFLETELGDDAAYEIDDIRSALAGIDIDRDPDDTASWADEDDEDYTVGDDFDDNVLTPLWDLLDEYNVWMPV